MNGKYLLDTNVIIYSINNKIELPSANYAIKLSDSIICATAYSNDMVLVTNDKQLQKVEEIEIKSIDMFLNENGK